MTYTPPTLRSTGNLITASIYNADIISNIILLATSIETATGKLSGNIKNHYEDVATPAIVANALPIDCSVADVIDVLFNADITTTTLTNVPVSGKVYNLEIYLKANGSPFVWTWLTATVLWDAVPTFVTTNGHYMRFLVSTKDGGATWRGLWLSSNVAA